jgi:hypothetical protein
MKLVALTILTVFTALCVNAQTDYPPPWNPDGNADGIVSVSDLMDLLTVFGEQYNAGTVSTDSTSAIFYLGDMDYWDCKSACYSLEGNWKVLDDFLVGAYKNALAAHTSMYLDRGHGGDYSTSWILYGGTWDVNGVSPTTSTSCVCQTRVVPVVSLDP